MEDIPEEFQINPVVELSRKDLQRDSHYRYAFEMCDLGLSYANPNVFRRLDHYQRKVSKILKDIEKHKYSHSHGKGVPERGFSVKKILLELISERP